MSNQKIKILTLSDNPLAPSGVGIQTKNMIEGLLKTGKFSFFSFAGAIKHNNYDPVQSEVHGEDWIIQPVDGFGNDEQIRSILRTFKPDIMWFMTDPRFFEWLWALENEIRPNVPMVYYHVWDNYPYPTFNKKLYDSNDLVATISKVTDDIVKTVSPDVKSIRIPHAVDTNIYRKIEDEEAMKKYVDFKGDKTFFFWNNRNARRKQSGTLIFWFKEFLDKVGKDAAVLLMHTDPADPNGQDLPRIIDHLDLGGSVFLSTQKMPAEELAKLYNAADCTINISDAEGFGLATLESLACETPIIVNMTGGLQEQVVDNSGTFFGIGIEPASKAVIGSLTVPWIYEDRIAKDDFINALEVMHKMPPAKRAHLGKLGRAHALSEYNMESYIKNWKNALISVHKENGSWENRKNYKTWKIREVV